MVDEAEYPLSILSALKLNILQLGKVFVGVFPYSLPSASLVHELQLGKS